jgi:hypothetical protein
VLCLGIEERDSMQGLTKAVGDVATDVHVKTGVPLEMGVEISNAVNGGR